jgi:hypothetical protein
LLVEGQIIAGGAAADRIVGRISCADSTGERSLREGQVDDRRGERGGHARPRLDRRDIRIDLEGTPGAARQRVGKTALAFDLDGNGKVGPSEYWRYVRRSFVDPIRRGGSGPLTLAKVKAFYEASS